MLPKQRAGLCQEVSEEWLDVSFRGQSADHPLAAGHEGVNGSAGRLPPLKGTVERGRLRFRSGQRVS